MAIADAAVVLGRTRESRRARTIQTLKRKTIEVSPEALEAGQRLSAFCGKNSA